MKNNLLNLFLFVIVVFFTACVDKKEQVQDTLSTNFTNLNFAADGNTKQTVTVETNVDNWNFSLSDDWMIPEKESKNSLSVTVQANAGTAPRSGTIIVTAGSAEPVAITVVQGFTIEDDVLSANLTELEFVADATEPQIVTVSTNVVGWNVVSPVSWISAIKKSATTFSVTVEKNTETVERDGVIVVTAGKAEMVIIPVVQQAGEEVDVPIHWAAQPTMWELRAFPGAEGYGQNATGGRGGKVVAVTNLLDDTANPPEGSLRWALRQHSGQPITVVFRVSGTIDLNGNDLRVKRNDFTIAGQTAPGDGICLIRGNVNLGGSRNVIVRHIRSRVGLTPGGGFIEGASLSLENGGNFIIDHCSFSWSAEENIGFYDNDNSTVQWCIISEGLYDAGHGKGQRGYGAVVGGKTATYHHNLIANNASRSPRYGATTKNDPVMLLDYVNNVHYNWGRSGAIHGGDQRQGAIGKFQINIVKNYYKPGPAYPGTSATKLVGVSFWDTAPIQGRNQSFWHLDGNYIEGTANASINQNNYNGLDYDAFKNMYPDISLNDFKSDRFVVPYPVIIETAQEAYISVLAETGAFPRDVVDVRIVEEVRTGTALGSGSFGSRRPNSGIIDHPDAVGGYPTYQSKQAPLDSDGDGIPDEWEIFYKLKPNDPADGVLKTLSGGTYTNLEVYLYDLVRKKQ